MKPIKKLLNRYSQESTSNSSVQFPKTISKERVFKRAWTWHKNESGVPGYFNLSFQKALQMAWESENKLIDSEGAIYLPYIMAND